MYCGNGGREASMPHYTTRRHSRMVSLITKPYAGSLRSGKFHSKCPFDLAIDRYNILKNDY